MFNKTAIFALLLTVSIISFNTNSKSIASNVPASIGTSTTQISNIFSAKQPSESELKKELKALDELYSQQKIDKDDYEQQKEQINFQLENLEEKDLDRDNQLIDDEDYGAIDNQADETEPATTEIEIDDEIIKDEE